MSEKGETIHTGEQYPDAGVHREEDGRPYNWLVSDETLIKMREAKRIELERNMNEIIDTGGVEELSTMRSPEIYIKKVAH